MRDTVRGAGVALSGTRREVILRWLEPYAGPSPRNEELWWVRLDDPLDANKIVVRPGPPPQDDWEFVPDEMGYRLVDGGDDDD